MLTFRLIWLVYYNNDELSWVFSSPLYEYGLHVCKCECFLSLSPSLFSLTLSPYAIAFISFSSGWMIAYSFTQIRKAIFHLFFFSFFAFRA